MGAVRLTDSLVDGVSPTFFTSAFHSMMEHHILDLATSEAAQPLTLEKSMAVQYNGDLNGLLSALGVPLQYQWMTMRCNGLYGATDYRSDMINLVQPSFEEIDELHALYITSTAAVIN